jgi:FkbM family methyltransferase
MLKRYLFAILEYLLFRVYDINRPTRKRAKIYDKIYPVYRATIMGERIKLYCPNFKVFKRCDSFARKEPETVEWINSFSPLDTLFDIGANIGLYSLLAAKKGLRVVAFEPESQNFAVLNANIFLNKLDCQIRALSLALANGNALDYLHVPDFSSGSAFNQFGIGIKRPGAQSQETYKQAAISYSLDAFIEIFCQQTPTHIKIDVDGIEAQVISGAIKTLENAKVKSILVELNDNFPEDKDAIKCILLKGFRIISQSSKGETGWGNYIFSR